MKKRRQKRSPLDIFLIVVVFCIAVDVLISSALGLPRSDLVRTLDQLVSVLLAFWARTR
jgi:hypothetical protein